MEFHDLKTNPDPIYRPSKMTQSSKDFFISSRVKNLNLLINAFKDIF